MIYLSGLWRPGRDGGTFSVFTFTVLLNILPRYAPLRFALNRLADRSIQLLAPLVFACLYRLIINIIYSSKY